MIVVVVLEHNLDDMAIAINSINHKFDVIELRLDLLRSIDFFILKSIIDTTKHPIICTLRSKQHGGYYDGTETSRLRLIEEISALNPEFLDIENFVSDDFIAKISSNYPAIKIIRSYHCLTETPENLDCILENMRHASIKIYKVVTLARSSLDNLRVLHFLRRHSQRINLTAHCFGKLALPSRIMGAILGNYMHYTVFNAESSLVPYCPDLTTLLEVYNFRRINCATKVYALLGNPVEHSIGHIFHNKKFHELDINAVYIKIELTHDNLEQFFEQIQGLPFFGFSITSPLKINVVSYVNYLDTRSRNIGAVNTIKKIGKSLFATNTDGLGAVSAILDKRPIKNSNVLIVGAGGTARAIAYEVSSLSPKSLSIVNRSFNKALMLASKVGGFAYEYTELESLISNDTNIVINTVALAEKDDKEILQTIMDDTVYMVTDYSTKYQTFSGGCSQVGPLELYRNQALLQLEYWFKNNDSSGSI